MALAVAVFVLLSPLALIGMLFYDEDPTDSYKFQNW